MAAKKNVSLRPEKFITLEWHDPTSETGWVTREKALETSGPTMVSCGWLVGETDTEFVLAMDWCLDDANVNTVGRIRKALVTGVKTTRMPRLGKYPAQPEKAHLPGESDRGKETKGG